MVAKTNPTLRAQWLGKLLRDLREENGLTLKEVAEFLRRAQSSMSRFEAGLLPISQTDVRELMNLYGVDGEHQRTALLQLAEEINRTGWWDRYTKDIGSSTIDSVWLESRSERIRVFSPLVVTGLLQTIRYAETLITTWNPDASKQQIERWVSIRMTRQKILNRETPTRLLVILDEAALHRPVGSPEIMAEQLRHLITMGERPNIEVRVLPFSVGAYPNQASEVMLLKLADPFPEVVNVESAAGMILLERDDVTRLSNLYGRLESTCLNARDSAAFIAALEKERS